MCLNPKKGYLIKYNVNGEVVQKVLFGLPKNLNQEVEEINIKCGKCYECQLLHSSNWAFRCMKESSLYEKNSFVTLTFAKSNGVLEKRPLQLFLKRLRKKFKDRKIRYVACGEYGSKNSRPHYHLILFNCDFDDKYIFDKRAKLYRSSTLEKLWPFGFSSIGDVTFRSCKYIVKYMQKLDSGQKKGFFCCSLRPGIGLGALEMKNQSSIMYFDGKRFFMPRYFKDSLNKNGFIVDKSAEYQLMKLSKNRDLNLIENKYRANGLILKK